MLAILPSTGLNKGSGHYVDEGIFYVGKFSAVSRNCHFGPFSDRDEGVFRAVTATLNMKNKSHKKSLPGVMPDRLSIISKALIRDTEPTAHAPHARKHLHALDRLPG